MGILPSEIDVMYTFELNCPNVRKLKYKISTLKKFKRILKKGKKDRDRISKIIKTSRIKKGAFAENWDLFFDILTSNYCHNKQPICNDGVCTTYDDLKIASHYYNLENKFTYFDNKHSKNYSILSGGYLLRDLMKELSSIIEHDAQKNDKIKIPKISIYSGHDLNLNGILGILRPDNQSFGNPKFASNLVIELWKHEYIKNEYRVRIIYNGKVLSLFNEDPKPKWCDSKSCDFLSLKSKIYDSTDADFYYMCNSKDVL
ncbi:2-phosphoxylose phosphatase 1 [Smittium culicis]|uniref:2-phosphoxylose phosphatase 1 n=1 Tax=Smittium culicis TaxID=133412 RepID=A0A1R1YCR9_9FUNG|nr:2-phosphoxylose phosphatase 1 [Smittium culicis]